MDTIGDARSSPASAEMLDAIALLHASGVGSANRSEDARLEEVGGVHYLGTLALIVKSCIWLGLI